MLYKSPESYIARQLEHISPRDRPRRRLEFDLADILTGPTSGGNAARLAECAIGEDPELLAQAMLEAAQRYLQRVKE